MSSMVYVSSLKSIANNYFCLQSEIPEIPMCLEERHTDRFYFAIFLVQRL